MRNQNESGRAANVGQRTLKVAHGKAITPTAAKHPTSHEIFLCASDADPIGSGAFLACRNSHTRLVSPVVGPLGELIALCSGTQQQEDNQVI